MKLFPQGRFLVGFIVWSILCLASHTTAIAEQAFSPKMSDDLNSLPVGHHAERLRNLKVPKWKSFRDEVSDEEPTSQGSSPITRQIFQDLGVREAIERGHLGQGVVVSVFDTAIDVSHPEFDGRILDSFDMFNGGAPITASDGDHGTHVAGTIAAALNGVGTAGIAPRASLVPIRGLSSRPGIPVGVVSFGELNDLAPAAIDFAIANNAQAINNSWGIGLPATVPGLRPFLDVLLPDLLDAYRRASDAGVINVFATGNDFQLEPGFFASLPFLYPELGEHWIAVTAIDSDAEIANFANFCGVAADWCIAAPGVAVDSTVPGGGFGLLSGTSMATPHVTGALAVARSIFPAASSDALVDIVLQTATDAGAPGVDNRFGHGILNIGNLASTADPATASPFAQAAAARFAAVEQVRLALPGFRGSGPTETTATAPLQLAYAGEGLTNVGAGHETRIWANGIRGSLELRESVGSPGAKAVIGGGLVGADFVKTSNSRFGAAIGITETRLDSTVAGNETDGTGVHFIGYGDWAEGSMFASLGAQVAFFDQDVRRAGISGAIGTAGSPIGESSTTAVAFDLWTEVGKNIRLNEQAVLAPYVTMSGRWQHNGSFAEQGANVFNLRSEGANTAQFDIGPGIRLIAGKFAWGDTLWRTSSDVQYAFLAGDRAHEVTTTLLGTPIVGQTTELGKHVLRLGAEISASSTDGSVTGFLSYGARFQDNATSQIVSAGVRAGF